VYASLCILVVYTRVYAFLCTLGGIPPYIHPVIASLVGVPPCVHPGIASLWYTSGLLFRQRK